MSRYDQSLVPPVLAAFSAAFSIVSVAVYRRWGVKPLILGAIGEWAVAMAFLFYVGWAHTSESPLVLSLFVVTIVVSLIALTTHAVGQRRPIVAILLASSAAFVGYYVAAVMGYIALLVIG